MMLTSLIQQEAPFIHKPLRHAGTGTSPAPATALPWGLLPGLGRMLSRWAPKSSRLFFLVPWIHAKYHNCIFNSLVGRVCSTDCLLCRLCSAWKVSGSTGHPLLVPQPLWAIMTTSIHGLREAQDMAGGMCS